MTIRRGFRAGGWYGACSDWARMPAHALLPVSSPAVAVAHQLTSASRVLIVEDDRELGRSYLRILRQAGYHVETATEGRLAAVRAASGDFDVVLTDITLPDIDGLELLRRIREHDRDLPVIVITGVPAMATAIQAVEYGALHYIVKPCGDRQLKELVAEGVRVRQLTRLKNAALATVAGQEDAPRDADRLEASVVRAVDSLWIAYQPIVRWSARGIFAFEALLRTREPTLSDPMALMDAAGRLGRLHQVARAVRARVAADLPSAPAEHLFVNVHPSDLLDEDLYSPAAPLSRHAHRVVLELTERAPLAGIPDAATRIASLRELGYRIAVDDLGSGYSTLNYFAELQPEVAKIDMTLVRDVHRTPSKAVLIDALKGACDALGIMTIAEGVETAEELGALARRGCDLFQGYLFARPAPAFPAPSWPAR